MGTGTPAEAMVSDQELVTRSLGGDAGAYGLLVERHQGRVLRVCHQRVGDYHEAEDLAQEAFLGAFFDLHALREPEKFGTWVRVIALRLCQSWHRRRRELPLDDIARTAGDDFTALSAVESSLAIQQALRSLSCDQQAVLTLKYAEGFSLAEIAQRLSIPLETVRTRLRRAKQRLREVYTAMGNEEKSLSARVLEKLEYLQVESGLLWPLYTSLRARGKDWSLGYVAGVTGTAFRFTIDAEASDTGPTHVLDWDHWFAVIEELGNDVSVFNAQLKSFSPEISTNTEEEFRATQRAAWEAARRGLDRGVPAIAWMPMTLEQKAKGVACEYGLLVGYDETAGEYRVRVPGVEMYSVPWDGFGYADPVNWFNVIVFGDKRPIDLRALELKSIRYAVKHAHSPRAGHGLRAYSLWMDSLRAGRLQSDGAPRAARLVREGRELAAQFLHEIAEHFPTTGGTLSKAAREYQDVAAAWHAYLRVFMPAATDAARDPEKQRLGVEALERAFEAEKEAVGALVEVVEAAER